MGVFSLSATLQSYTGDWGRVRLSDHSPPDPSRKLPTASTDFPPGFLYGSLENWAVPGTGPNLDAPSLPCCCCCSRLGKTRMDPSFKVEKKKRRKEKKKKKEEKADPSFHMIPRVWSFDQRKKRGPSRRKPDPEEHRRVGGGSPLPEVHGFKVNSSTSWLTLITAHLNI